MLIIKRSETTARVHKSFTALLPCALASCPSHRLPYADNRRDYPPSALPLTRYSPLLSHSHSQDSLPRSSTSARSRPLTSPRLTSISRRLCRAWVRSLLRRLSSRASRRRKKRSRLLSVAYNPLPWAVPVPVSRGRSRDRWRGRSRHRLRGCSRDCSRGRARNCSDESLNSPQIPSTLFISQPLAPRRS